MQETICEGCGRSIFYVKLRGELKEWTPLNKEPVMVRKMLKGGASYITGDGTIIFGNEDAAEDGCVEAYVPHYATCTNPPKGGRFRRPK